MQREPGRVLVIDDDEVVLVAVSDLLEEQGYRVYTLGSPIGATQVIARESIDIAVIDVNLPDMQGDSVVRLFRTWDRMKDLPIVMLSGAESSTLEQLRRELPGVQIVRKSDMNRALVPTLDQVLAATRATRAQRRPAATRTTDPSGDPLKNTRELQQSYLDDLAESMALARSVWPELMQGESARSVQLMRALEAMRHRAQLLNLDAVSQLLSALSSVVAAIKPGVIPSTRAQRVVDDGIAALSALQTSRTRDFPVSPTFLIRDLVEVATELQARSSRR